MPATPTPIPATADAGFWTAALRQQGKRVTRQRLAVLDAVHHVPHGTTDAVLTRVREHLPEITAQSVYGVLGDLTEWGLVRKLDTPASAARYETRTGDNHHHVMCVRCGAVADVACVVGHAPCLEPSETGGMQVVAAEVLFHGICADCATAE